MQSAINCIQWAPEDGSPAILWLVVEDKSTHYNWNEQIYAIFGKNHCFIECFDIPLLSKTAMMLTLKNHGTGSWFWTESGNLFPWFTVFFDEPFGDSEKMFYLCNDQVNPSMDKAGHKDINGVVGWCNYVGKSARIYRHESPCLSIITDY